VRRGALAGAALALLAAGPALAEVRVRYVEPERFTDAQNRTTSGMTLRVTLAEMTRAFEEFGARTLPPGDALDVTVTDIDLAGFERPGFSGPDGVRVVSDVSPPRIRLSYVLRRGRQRLAAGEETLTDINFMLTANARFSSGPLYYERALLRDWFTRRFGPARR